MDAVGVMVGLGGRVVVGCGCGAGVVGVGGVGDGNLKSEWLKLVLGLL